MNERCSGSDLMCEDDHTEVQKCPGCGLFLQTVTETWLWSAGKPVRRRRWPEHRVSRLETIADFFDQLKAG